MDTSKSEAPVPAKPKPLTLKQLEKVAADGKKKAAGRSKKKDQHAPTYREPPKGQHKGAIVVGPADWIVCTTCSRLFSTPEDPRRVGIRKRHAAKHLSDHRMGRIKRPTVTPATEKHELSRRERILRGRKARAARKAAKAKAAR